MEGSSLEASLPFSNVTAKVEGMVQRVIGPWANLRLVDKRSKELVELLATSVS